MKIIHALSAHFALLAMLLSALAPSGFMPRWGEQGFTIAICSPGSGSAIIAADNPLHDRLADIYQRMRGDIDDDHPAGNDDLEGMPECAFASPGGLALPDIAGPTLLNAPFRSPEPLWRSNLSASLAETVLPPATGPPSLFF